MERTLAERLQDCAHGLSLGADGMGWSPDPALLREAAEEVERLRAQNARLGREAHTWWTACRDATGEIERLRGVLLKIEAGEYLHLPTMVRDALGPNVGGEARLAAHQPSHTTTATPQGVASTDQLGGRVRSEKD